MGAWEKLLEEERKRFWRDRNLWRQRERLSKISRESSLRAFIIGCDPYAKGMLSDGDVRAAWANLQKAAIQKYVALFGKCPPGWEFKDKEFIERPESIPIKKDTQSVRKLVVKKYAK